MILPSLPFSLNPAEAHANVRIVHALLGKSPPTKHKSWTRPSRMCIWKAVLYTLGLTEMA